MRPSLQFFPSILACLITIGTSQGAGTLSAKPCSFSDPEAFVIGQPFLLKDPRSGSFLYVESDGRHMSAISPDGSLLWHRDLFGGRIQRFFIPPPNIEGEPSPSPKELRRQAQSWANHLGIDRVGVEPNCARQFIDHKMPSQFRGHYIQAGSGTHYGWLIDAKMGDVQMETTN